MAVCFFSLLVHNCIHVLHVVLQGKHAVVILKLQALVTSLGFLSVAVHSGCDN